MKDQSGTTFFWVQGKRCPRCGSPLVSDGKHAWCVFVSMKTCDYGIGQSVKLESLNVDEIKGAKG
jgi:hypothetical protein